MMSQNLYRKVQLRDRTALRSGLLLLSVAFLLLATTVAQARTNENNQSTCYELTLSHTGEGSDPTAEPAKSENCSDGEYGEQEAITLTATPDNGWHVISWSGTDDDDSTATTNTVTMPGVDHSVTVNYEIIPPTCHSLTLSHDGEGADPTADPPNSPGCQANQYIAGESITLTAKPAQGSRVMRWYGTDDDKSTLVTNTATMPDANHAVKVSYEEIPSTSTPWIALPIVLADWPKWQPVGNALDDLYTVIACSDKRFAGASNALYKWENAQWIEIPNAPINVRDFLFVGENCDTLYAASYKDGVWQLLPDNTWTQVGQPLPTARSLALQDGTLLYVATHNGIFSYDLAQNPVPDNWTMVSEESEIVTRLSQAGDRLFAAVFGQGVKYYDPCLQDCTWNNIGNPTFKDAFDAVGDGGGEIPGWAVMATAAGVFHWNGTMWSVPSSPPQPAGNVFALEIIGELVLAGVQNGGVWVSSDYGDTWALFNESPVHTVVDLVLVPGDGLYVVTPNNGVWRWPLR